MSSAARPWSSSRSMPSKRECLEDPPSVPRVTEPPAPPAAQPAARDSGERRGGRGRGHAHDRDLDRGGRRGRGRGGRAKPESSGGAWRGRTRAIRRALSPAPTVVDPSGGHSVSSRTLCTGVTALIEAGKQLLEFYVLDRSPDVDPGVAVQQALFLNTLMHTAGHSFCSYVREIYHFYM